MSGTFDDSFLIPPIDAPGAGARSSTAVSFGLCNLDEHLPDIPDLAAIIADRTVRGEFAHSGDVEN